MWECCEGVRVWQCSEGVRVWCVTSVCVSKCCESTYSMMYYFHKSLL